MLKGGGANKLGPGQITSDTEMAMCLLNAANDDVKHLNLDKILTYLAKWRDSDPSSLGYTTIIALEDINKEDPQPT